MKAKFNQITKLIKEADSIYLYRHINPDPDALGSTFGLKEIIKDNFNDKKIIVCGHHYPHLAHLFPKENKKQKVVGQKTLAIISDTANIARIDNQNWKECHKSIKIDHHPSKRNYGKLNVIDPKAISAAQIITQWAIDQKLKISKKAATYLFTGIVTDSGRFLFPQTSSKTFSVVAKLLESKVDINEVYEKLYTRDIKHAKFNAYLINNAKIQNKVAYIYIDQKTAKKFKFTIHDIALHANFFSGFDSIDIWSLARFDKDGIKVSIRSKEKYAVNKVLEKFNGGGHKNAAATIVKNKKEYNKIISELKKLTKK